MANMKCPGLDMGETLTSLGGMRIERGGKSFATLKCIVKDVFQSRNSRLIQQLENDPDVTSFVHEIYINWAPGVVPRQDSKEGLRLIHQLIDLFPRFTHNLQHSQQLVALEIVLDRTQLQALSELREAFRTCTKLQKLQVSCLPFPTAPRSEYGSDFALCAPGEQLPPLKVLRLREMTITGYSVPGWERCLQWETLEHLQCRELEFFPKIYNSLKRLRSLVIDISTDTSMTSEQGEAVMDFVRTSSKLEELSLTGMSDFLPLRQFCSARYSPKFKSPLRYLKIHENQEYHGRQRLRHWSRAPLTWNYEEIEDLAHLHPRLERCNIDLKVEDDWPWEKLTGIAESLWFIVKLELNLELHIPEPSNPLPVATIHSVHKIWTFLWHKIESFRKAQNHITSRPRLRTLRVFEGSFRQVWDVPEEIMYQERREQAIFEARISECDDLAERGHADVTCLALEALRNKYGRGPNNEHPHVNLMRYVTSRAEEGPAQRRPIDLGNQLDLLRPLRTPLLGLVDAN
ncbi:MAG: hypothetical protein Q9170_006983 [Blastenia crenularia]